ncbi:MAG: MFS transporter [Rhizobiales bacterium]|nr:MFS transporter [Hyphomicrobiales bacterium]
MPEALPGTESDEPAAPPLSLYRNPSFACFAVMRIFNSAALQMLNVAVGWQVYELTGNPLDLGLVGLAQFVPVLALFLVSGLVADRFNRRSICVVTNLVAAAISGLFLYYALSGGTAAWPIFLLLVVHGAAKTFFQPTVNAVLANVVPREQFAAAVALSSSVLKAGFMLGPAIGGFLIALIGMWVYLVVGICFAIAGLAAIPMVLVGVKRSTNRIDLETVLGGFSFVWLKKIMLGAITLDLIAVLFSGIMGMLPVFAKDVLHVGPEGLGIMRTMPAVGGLVVGIVLTQLPSPRHMGPTLFISTFVLGASTIAFAYSEVFWFSIVMLAVWGGSDMLSVYVRQTIMQVATPDEMRGRVNAVSSVAINASNELGDFRAGLMAAWITTIPAVVVGGIATIAATLAWSRMFPDLRRVDRIEDL